MITVPITLTATAQSVASLVESELSTIAQSMVGDRNDLRMNIIVQALEANGSNVNFGSPTDQSGFIVAGGSLTVCKMNMNQTYLVGNTLGVVIHLMD